MTKKAAPKAKGKSPLKKDSKKIVKKSKGISASKERVKIKSSDHKAGWYALPDEYMEPKTFTIPYIDYSPVSLPLLTSTIKERVLKIKTDKNKKLEKLCRWMDAIIFLVIMTTIAFLLMFNQYAKLRVDEEELFQSLSSSVYRSDNNVLDSNSSDDPSVTFDSVARVSCYNTYGTMASGKTTYAGAAASSDRSIPLGTKILLEGLGEFTIEDRTATWINDFGFTIDVYSPDCDMNWGIKRLNYKIM